MNEGFNPPVPPDPHHITIEVNSLDLIKGKSDFPKPPQRIRELPPLPEQVASVEEKIKLAFKAYVDHAGELGGDMRTEELLRLHRELSRLKENT